MSLPVAYGDDGLFHHVFDNPVMSLSPCSAAIGGLSATYHIATNTRVTGFPVTCLWCLVQEGDHVRIH